MPKKQKANNKSAADYEKLGRQIEAAYLSGYIDRKRLITNSVIRGIGVGFGSIIGATIVIALLLWVLSVLNEIPLIGPVSEKLETTIERNN